MRRMISVVVVILVAAGAIYYFYGYRHRSVSGDINAVDAYTDEATTTSAVKTALAMNKQVASLDVHVETTSDGVKLTGHVPNADDKRVVEEIAHGTKGVTSVVNNIEIGANTAANPEKQDVIDLEIKAAVLESILNSANLKTQQIKVEVSAGRVQLKGSVEDQGQKSAAEAAARAIDNVRSVDSTALAVTDKGAGQL